jgi:hypothetical protein
METEDAKAKQNRAFKVKSKVKSTMKSVVTKAEGLKRDVDSALAEKKAKKGGKDGKVGKVGK